MCRQAKLWNEKRFNIKCWNQLPAENAAGGKQRGPGSEGKAESGFETWRDPEWNKTWGENTDAGREVQPWEGTRVHTLHEKHREKILPVTGRKIGPGRCWDCMDPANVCFGAGQVEEKGQCILSRQ